ncbi:MAG TPA: hypothetical protein PK765_00710 [bacterium]|nr:hypothetical protein [bacterium]
MRIFPSYRHGVLATRDTAAPDPHKQSRIDAHIEDSIAELESIALKILRLVESQSKEDFALAVDVVNAITGELP